jgi:hypothetical protein
VLVISKEYLDRNKLFFYKRFAHNLPILLISKTLAEHWDLPNTGIFYSKDVASRKGQNPHPDILESQIRILTKIVCGCATLLLFLVQR